MLSAKTLFLNSLVALQGTICRLEYKWEWDVLNSHYYDKPTEEKKKREQESRRRLEPASAFSLLKGGKGISLLTFLIASICHVIFITINFIAG